MSNDKRKQHNKGASGPGATGKGTPTPGGQGTPAADQPGSASAPGSSIERAAGAAGGETPAAAASSADPRTQVSPSKPGDQKSAPAAKIPESGKTASSGAPRAPDAGATANLKSRSPGRVLSLIALLLAVVAILLTLLLNYRFQSQQATVEADDRPDRALALAQQALDEAQALRPELESVQGDMGNRLSTQGNAMEALRQDLSSLGESSSAARVALQSEIDTLALAQRGLGSALDVVKDTLASGGDSNAWTLSEVGYLLEIADHRLRFQEDVSGSLQALVLAKQRLAQVNELAFAPVLQMLDETIAALRGVEPLDRSALAQRIAVLGEKAGELPLRNESRTQALKDQAAAERASLGTEVDTAKTGWWRDALSSIWAETKRLVVVRRERRDGPPLIAPDEEYFLVANLQLKLEALRLAALAGDGASYQDSLDLAQGWIERYFDTGSDAVVGVQKEIKSLQQVELHPYLPDVGRVAQAYDDVMKTRQPVRTLPGEPGPASSEQSPAEGDNTTPADGAGAPAEGSDAAAEQQS
jgi:uroporphyrin-3 C-methyltransferase